MKKKDWLTINFPLEIFDIGQILEGKALKIYEALLLISLI